LTAGVTINLGAKAKLNPRTRLVTNALVCTYTQMILINVFVCTNPRGT